MKLYLGADLGGSATKLPLCDPHGKLLAETQCPSIRTSAALTAAVHAFLKTQGRAEEEVESMAMTGVGSSYIEGPVIGKEPLKIDEMQAVGQGAQALSRQQDILAVSMGTGTALIRADHARIRHIGGTGVGGGTLAGLALRLTGMETADFVALRSFRECRSEGRRSDPRCDADAEFRSDRCEFRKAGRAGQRRRPGCRTHQYDSRNDRRHGNPGSASGHNPNDRADRCAGCLAAGQTPL